MDDEVARMHRDVVCAGILVADIFVPAVPHLPGAGQLIATDDFLIETGGCAANVANALARLKVTATVVGKIGDDLFADFVEARLAANHVRIDGISRTGDYGTSKTIILSIQGEDRRYLHTFGANAAFGIEDIDRSLVDTARLFYVGGFFVLPRLKASHLAELFACAQRQNTRTLLDVVVPAGQHDADSASFAHLLEVTDFFMPNDEEARMLTGFTDPQKQAGVFLDAGCGAVIITMGDRGTLYRDADQTIFLPPYPIDFVDGSGAGDAFAAGLMVGLLENWDIRDSLQFASAVGASACTALGCTTGVFTRTEARNFIALQRS